MVVRSNDLVCHHVDLPSGRRVTFFVNKSDSLVVVDVIHPNERGGSEVLRLYADQVDLSHCERRKRPGAVVVGGNGGSPK